MYMHMYMRVRASTCTCMNKLYVAIVMTCTVQYIMIIGDCFLSAPEMCFDNEMNSLHGKLIISF